MSALELVACACGCGRHLVQQNHGGWQRQYILGHAPSGTVPQAAQRAVARVVRAAPVPRLPSAELTEIAWALEAPWPECVVEIVATGSRLEFRYA